MEDVLEVYQRPYDPAQPVIVRTPLPLSPGSPERFDTEYERNGTSNIFMFFEPLAGKRYTDVTDTRTSIDWALQIRDLVDNKYQDAKRITLVMDNLNTHVGGSLYKAFSPAEAQRIMKKLEIHYTPKHGSWLNMAEIELSILARQCLNRRIPDQRSMKKEVAAWQRNRNLAPKKMDWQFTTEDARIKLKKLYPSYSS